jgi:hypothetical protein
MLAQHQAGPTGSTFTAFSTFVSTLGLMRICPGLASSQSREATLALRADGLAFMPSPPATYYEHVDQRVPEHGENLARLQRNGILIDGEGAVAVGQKEGKLTKVLLQIFSANLIGPIFFEFIQRKGDEGFGEGNFRALFVSSMPACVTSSSTAKSFASPSNAIDDIIVGTNGHFHEKTRSIVGLSRRSFRQCTRVRYSRSTRGKHVARRCRFDDSADSVVLDSLHETIAGIGIPRWRKSSGGSLGCRFPPSAGLEPFDSATINQTFCERQSSKSLS